VRWDLTLVSEEKWDPRQVSALAMGEVAVYRRLGTSAEDPAVASEVVLEHGLVHGIARPHFEDLTNTLTSVWSLLNGFSYHFGWLKCVLGGFDTSCLCARFVDLVLDEVLVDVTTK